MEVSVSEQAQERQRARDNPVRQDNLCKNGFVYSSTWGDVYLFVYIEVIIFILRMLINVCAHEARLFGVLMLTVGFQQS